MDRLFFTHMGLFNIFKTQKKDMYDTVNRVEKDSGGNVWYMREVNNLFSPFSRQKAFTVEYNMPDNYFKGLALSVCRPFAMVCTRCGSMMQNAHVYVTDAKGNEKRSFRDIVSLMQHPNPLQTGRSFLKDIEIMLKCYGYCPVYLVRGLPSDLPRAMYIIRPELFHVEGTGEIYGNYSKKDLIKRAYIRWNNQDIELPEYEYCLIVDSMMEYSDQKGGELVFHAITDSLTHDVRNFMAQAIARGNLIINGGPKAIIYGDDTSDTGNAALTKEESDDMNASFKRRFGLVNKPYEIMVTNKKIGVAQLGSTAQQMMLTEEEKSCIYGIANAIGVNPNVFMPDSTYANLEEAKVSVYQDLIIPDSENIAEALTSSICPEGTYIRLDFSHVSCLQKNKKSLSESLGKATDALSTLLNSGIIDVREARTELANYLDINPDEMPEQQDKQREQT